MIYNDIIIYIYIYLNIKNLKRIVDFHPTIVLFKFIKIFKNQQRVLDFMNFNKKNYGGSYKCNIFKNIKTISLFESSI